MGQLATSGWVSLGGFILSTAAAATLQHINCCFLFPEASVFRTSGDWVKVSRSVQWGGRDRLRRGRGRGLSNCTPPPRPVPSLAPG